MTPRRSDKPRTPLAQALINLRDRESLSQEQLAELIKVSGGQVSASHIGLIESGKRNASPQALLDIVEALHLNSAEAEVLFDAAVKSAAPSRPFLRPAMGNEQPPNVGEPLPANLRGQWAKLTPAQQERVRAYIDGLIDGAGE